MLDMLNDNTIENFSIKFRELLSSLPNNIEVTEILISGEHITILYENDECEYSFYSKN